MGRNLNDTEFLFDFFFELFIDRLIMGRLRSATTAKRKETKLRWFIQIVSSRVCIVFQLLIGLVRKR